MKEFQIIIAEPCSQKWEDMHEVLKGRHCDNCKKTVVDLSTKTDAELIQFFKKKDEHVCGRLLPAQLNRTLVEPRSKLNWPWLVPMALGAAIVSPVHAQNVNVKTVQLGTGTPLTAIVGYPDTLTQSTYSGRVIDSFTGKPLVGVKIKKHGYQNVLAITDTAGRFEIRAAIDAVNHLYSYELPGYTSLEVALTHQMIVRLSSMKVVLGRASFVETTNKPLYVIKAGSNSCTIVGDLQKIEPVWIESLEVLKPAEAAAIYGSKAANGVVVISVKKAYEHKIEFSKKDK